MLSALIDVGENLKDKLLSDFAIERIRIPLNYMIIKNDNCRGEKKEIRRSENFTKDGKSHRLSNIWHYETLIS